MKRTAWWHGAVSAVRLSAALVLVLLAPSVGADDPLGPECRFVAVVDVGDGSALRRYDGLRKGLEQARLPRICREAYDAARTRVALDRLATEVAEGAREPVLFVLGEDAARDVLRARPALPVLTAVRRYTVGGRPAGLGLDAQADHAGVVAQTEAAHVGRLLRQATGRERPRVLRPGPAPTDSAATWLEAAGVELADPAAPGRVDAVLDLGLEPAGGSGTRDAEAFARLRARAQALRAPIWTDDRTRFGHGAHVVLATDDDLVGRTLADLGRLALADREAPLPAVRAISSLEVWVDLEALDHSGIDVPLPFLARADRLRRGLPPGPEGR